jgi:hypothetical protein
LGDAGEGEADDIEVAAFDAGNVAAGAALDGVGAGFVKGLVGGEVAEDFFVGELGEVDEGGFDEGAALGVGEADESDAGEDRVGAAGELFEGAVSVVGRVRFAEDAAFESDDGVSCEDDGGTDGAGGDEFGFGVGEALDVFLRRFAGEGSFVDGGGEDGEGNGSAVENFGAAWGGGGEDEFHGSEPCSVARDPWGKLTADS